MMFFCEYMLNLFRLLAVILTVFTVVGVIPYFVMLTIEETRRSKAWAKVHEHDGRHRKGTGKNDTIITDIVIRFRDGREMIQHHRRVVHG
jgi:predicted membrane protein